MMRIGLQTRKKSALIYPELSYLLTGIFFKIHNSLGRYCRERQYSNELARLLAESGLPFLRGAEISAGNRCDFVIDDKILVELKTKPLLLKDDYYQVLRYLESRGLPLGMIVNFRNRYLKPKRIVNATLGIIRVN